MNRPLASGNLTLQRLRYDRAMIVFPRHTLEHLYDTKLGQALENLMIVLPNGRDRIDVKDHGGSLVEFRDIALGIGGDDAVCDRGEDVVHVLAVFFNFAQRTA